MAESFRVGPCKILVADFPTDPVSAWVDLGDTRGDVTVRVEAGRYAFGRADQLGGTPLADAVWGTGPRLSCSVPLLEHSLTKLEEVFPGSVLTTDGVDSALGFGNGVASASAKAYCLVPLDQYTAGSSWEEAADVIWIPRGIVVSADPRPLALPDGDDALSGSGHVIQIIATGGDWWLPESVRVAGMGPIYKLGTQVLGIGHPGATGFGVGVYPGSTLPTGIEELTGTRTLGHDNFGNYLVTNSQSVMVWVPAFWYKITNTVAAPYYGTKIEISPVPRAGYALHRAFLDGGYFKQGVFVDKYLWSNATAAGVDNTDVTGGIAASIKNRRPVSTNTANNRISYLTGNSQTPTDTYGGVFAAAKSRGNLFAPMSIFIHSALAMLALAHAQALMDGSGNPIAGATAKAAWMDLAPYAPKGCNNNALRDAQDANVLYTGSGYLNQPLTGSASPFNKTTHNGQACGIADLNGGMWEVVCGLTNVGGPTNATYRILKEIIALRDLVDATSGSFGAFGSTPYDLLGAVWWGDTADNWYFGNGTNQVLSEEDDRTADAYRLAACGIMKDAAAGSGTQVATNSFGGDSMYRKHTNLLAPRVGGDWGNSSSAGVWAVRLDSSRAVSYDIVGSRAVLYV